MKPKTVESHSRGLSPVRPGCGAVSRTPPRPRTLAPRALNANGHHVALLLLLTCVALQRPRCCCGGRSTTSPAAALAALPQPPPPLWRGRSSHGALSQQQQQQQKHLGHTSTTPQQQQQQQQQLQRRHQPHSRLLLMDLGTTAETAVPDAATAAAVAVPGTPEGPDTLAGVLAWMPHWATRARSQERFNRPLSTIWPEPDMATAHLFSQHQEDRHMYLNYFFGRRRGSYLEVGAYDGVRHSNSKFFAAALGWRGMLVEASPRAFRTLIVRRPNDLCVRATLCTPREAPLTFLSGQGPADGVSELMSPQHRSMWFKDLAQAAREGNVSSTFCTPLQAVLDYGRLRSVDFMSIDVNGAELEVLTTVDFTVFSAHVVLVRSEVQGGTQEGAVRTLLVAAGYDSRGARLGSEWFVHRSFRAVAAPSPPSQWRSQGVGTYLEDVEEGPEVEAAEVDLKAAAAVAAAALAAAEAADLPGMT